MAKTSDMDMLIKLIGMSTSDNDGEALNALRLAHKKVLTLVERSKTPAAAWDELIRGKFTIVADPFGDLPNPFKSREATTVSQPRPASPSPYSAPTQPQPRPASYPTNGGSRTRSGRDNAYAGRCIECGTYCQIGEAVLVTKDVATDRWLLACKEITPCESRQRAKSKPPRSTGGRGNRWGSPDIGQL